METRPDIAIVIPAYNRPESLARLLQSIGRAEYRDDRAPALVISLEGDAPPSVTRLAQDFPWSGRKEVVQHEDHMGLRKHILWCGDQSSRFDAVIVLEDDLLVSPHFFSYGTSAYKAYEQGDRASRIGSYSLYAFSLNGFVRLPFLPLDDGHDVYFIQTCSSCGQMWSTRQWSQFRSWYGEYHRLPVSVRDGLPAAVTRWPETSWKKYFNKFMVARDLYSVVPRVSLSTNFGDPGQNNLRMYRDLYQVPLLLRPKDWVFCDMDASWAVYDAYFEPCLSYILDCIGGIETADIECDTYASKPLALTEKRYSLSTKELEGAPLASFGHRMRPLIANVLHEVPGETILLGESGDFRTTRFVRRKLVRREVGFMTQRDRLILATEALKKRMRRRR